MDPFSAVTKGSFVLLFLSLGVVVSAAEQEAADTALRLDDYQLCGLNSLYVAAKLLDIPDLTLPRVKQALGPPDKEGLYSFAQLSSAATSLNLHPVALRVNPERLATIPMPAIVHLTAAGIQQPHLCVITGINEHGVYVLDPPYPVTRIAWSTFNRYWSGGVLVLCRTAEDAAIVSGSVEHWGWTASVYGSSFLVVIAAVALIARDIHGRRSRH